MRIRHESTARRYDGVSDGAMEDIDIGISRAEPRRQYKVL